MNADADGSAWRLASGFARSGKMAAPFALCTTMPDLLPAAGETRTEMIRGPAGLIETSFAGPRPVGATSLAERSEEHTSELQSLMRISYSVLCLKKTKSSNK